MESDEDFIYRMIEDTDPRDPDSNRLFALARRGAAAGDMLEALKEYACDCKGGCEADNSFDIHWKCGDAARAAILKAESTQEKQNG